VLVLYWDLNVERRRSFDKSEEPCFLQNALPPGFPRIRYYGLMANYHRAAKLKLCRQLPAAPLTDVLPRPTDYRDFYVALTGKNLRRCPQCGIGTMVRIQILGPGQAPVAIRMDRTGAGRRRGPFREPPERGGGTGG